jgi:hypothetical protein
MAEQERKVDQLLAELPVPLIDRQLNAALDLVVALHVKRKVIARLTDQAPGSGLMFDKTCEAVADDWEKLTNLMLEGDR